MFDLLLILHIFGALGSIFASGYGILGAITQQGNLRKIKALFVALAAFQTVSGSSLVLLKPSLSSLTTLCIGGISLFAIFFAVYYLARTRLATTSAKN